MFIIGLFFALALLPVAALIFIALTNANDGIAAWPHLMSYVVPQSLSHTIALLVMVALGTGIIGTSTAWLTVMCQFPGRQFFAWALVLPLAVPVYIGAYAQVEFFDFSGPVQNLVRSIGGYASARDYAFFDIRSLGGAAFVFSIVLYPYVYLTSRLVFSMQGASALDVSRTLGAGPWRMFFTVALPMARPALATGISLALLETLNDIGAVEILGVRTLAYAVFETWLNRDNLAGAVQLSLMTLLLVGFLIWLERWARRGRNFTSAPCDRPPALLQLSHGIQAWCIFLCALPLALGLGIPIFVLGRYALRRIPDALNSELFSATFNSLSVSFATALLTTMIAYGVLQYARSSKRTSIASSSRLLTLGYAIPGTILAVGLLVPLAAFDNALDGVMRSWFGISTGLLTSGTIAVVIYACTIRFLAIAYGTIDSGFGKMSTHVDMAARSLGRTANQTAFQIHMPMMRRVLGVAFLLVFVDTMKELSATILLRPFNFETLATLIYNRASQAAVEDAAVAALLIVCIGLIPTALLSRVTSR